MVRISLAESESVKRLGVALPVVQRVARPRASTGQGTLDAINAERRAKQEHRTIEALGLLGDSCPPSLRRAGELRVAYPDLSLEALGQLMQPPATRHTVCGQLRRLHQMAMRVQ
jgi:hypothetical protein